MTDDVRRVLPQGTGTPVTVPGPNFAAAVDTFMAGQRPWHSAPGWVSWSRRTSGRAVRAGSTPR